MPTDQARFDNSHRKSCMETRHSNYKKAARNKIMKFALAIKRQFEKPSLASDCLELLRMKSLHAENILLTILKFSNEPTDMHVDAHSSCLRIDCTRLKRTVTRSSSFSAFA